MTVGTFDVYTVGGIEYLSQVFRGIILIVGDSTWETFTKIFITAGIITAALIFLKTSKFTDFVVWFLSAFFAFGLFVGVKANVNIIDTQYEQEYLVSDVPLGPVILTSLFSSASYELTNLLGNVFHTGTV